MAAHCHSGRGAGAGFSCGFCDGITKLIPGVKPGKPILSIARGREGGGQRNTPSGRTDAGRADRQGRRCQDADRAGQKLEGMTRNIGMHAGGGVDRTGQTHRFLPPLRRQ
ncbi:MAG: hypothetical protein R3E42_19415 [Burkholderiaceae bacterium]